MKGEIDSVGLSRIARVRTGCHRVLFHRGIYRRAHSEVVFGPRQPVIGIEKAHRDRFVRVICPFALELLNCKTKEITCDVSLVRQFIRYVRSLVGNPVPANSPENQMPNAHANSYDEFKAQSKKWVGYLRMLTARV